MPGPQAEPVGSTLGRSWTAASPAHSLWARNELSDHLDAMDSNLDSLQNMLSGHGFSVDTSALLDVSLPACPPPTPRPPQALTPSLPPAAVQPLRDSAGHEPA